MEKTKKREVSRSLSLLVAFIFIFSFFIFARPVFSAEEVSASNETVDLEKLAKDQDKERKELEKKEKEDLKKLRKQGLPALPSESESVEEKLKRKEDAKRRLALFKEELEKKTETIRLESLSAQTPQTEAALAAEKQRAAELMRQKLEIEKELTALDENNPGVSPQEKEKAERERKEAEEKQKEETERKLKAEKEEQRIGLEKKSLEEKRQKELEKARAEEKKQYERRREEEAKHAEKLRKEKEKVEGEKHKELKKQKQEEEKRVRETEKIKKRLEAERQKEVERKARDEARKKEEALKAVKEKQVLMDAESIIAAHKTKEITGPTAPQPAVKEPVDVTSMSKVKETPKESSKHLKQAQDFLEKRAYTESQAELERVLAVEPENFIAKNLMAIVLAGEYIAEKEKADRNKILAGIVEEKEMHERFQSEMDRIDSEIQKSAEEGNRLYEKGNYQEANQSYLKVRALEAERRMIIDNILEKLAVRNQKSPEEMAPLEKAAQVETLLKEAAVYSEQERWDDAAEKYEAVFQLDPLNKKASDGLDGLREKIMKVEKSRREDASQELKTTIDQKVEFFVSEAKAVEAKGDREAAKTLAERALSLNPKDKAAQTVLEDLEKTKESVKV